MCQNIEEQELRGSILGSNVCNEGVTTKWSGNIKIKAGVFDLLLAKVLLIFAMILSIGGNVQNLSLVISMGHSEEMFSSFYLHLNARFVRVLQICGTHSIGVVGGLRI